MALNINKVNTTDLKKEINQSSSIPTPTNKTFGMKKGSQLKVIGPSSPKEFELVYNTFPKVIKATTVVQSEEVGRFYFLVYYDE